MRQFQNIVHNIFPEKPSVIYILIRNIIFIALCIFFVVYAASIWISYLLDPIVISSFPAPKMGMKTQVSDNKPLVIDSQVVLENNIFGINADKKIDRKEPDIVLEKIPLAQKLKNLELMGTIVGSDNLSLAIIKDLQKRSEEFYHEGDRLKNAQIKKILRNNIIVTIDGKDRVLSMDSKTRENIKQKTTSNHAQNQHKIKKSELLAQASNIQQIITSARIIPRMRNGSIYGYQIDNMKRNSLFKKLSLQDGDVVVSANGQKLSSPKQIMQLTKNIQSSMQQELSLTIRRDNKVITLNYGLE